MELKLKIEKKTFNNGGNSIEYYDITTEIKGQTIHLQFKDNDKSLATYLLKSMEAK